MFVAVSSFYGLKENFLGTRYTDVCKARMQSDEVVGRYRLAFNHIEAGETYRVGQPRTTTGYYTTYEISFGQAKEKIVCFADLDKKFVKAEATVNNIGCVRYLPDGRRQSFFGSCN